MKQFLIFYLIMICCSTTITAQQKTDRSQRSTFSIKAGYNIARITGKTPEFKPASENGFMVAASYSPASPNGLGFKTEIVYSRQGFGFSEDGKITAVTNDYIYMPQFTTFTIAKKVQLQLGGQIGYLLRSSQHSTASNKLNVTEAMNRIDYGAAGGLEIFPFKGFIVGGRYNMSLGNSFKNQGAGTVIHPFPFNPSDIKSKNAVINFYIGYRF